MNDASNFSANAKKVPFAEWLRDALHEKRMLAADLARELDTQNSTVSRWMAGSIPQQHTLERIEKILGQKFGEFSAEDAIQDMRLRAEEAALELSPIGLPANKFEAELAELTMSQMILVARVLSLSPHDKRETLHRIFRWMEKIEREEKPK